MLRQEGVKKGGTAPMIHIRLALPADAPDMAEIHMRSWEAAYKDIIPADYIREKNATRPALWESLITEDNMIYHIIEKDGQPVGLLCIAPPQEDDLDESFHELQGLYLHPDYYRQGIGTLAMAFAYENARASAKTNMIVWALAENIDALRFYEACGFKPDGKQQTRDYGREHIVIRMRKNL